MAVTVRTRPAALRAFVASLRVGRITRRRALALVVAFALVDLAWDAVLAAIEFSLGLAPHHARTIALLPNLEDAVWHLATAFVLVLPIRRRPLFALGPLLALELDVDHVFGFLLSTPLGRLAHDVFFAVLATVVLGTVFGRVGATLPAAAWFVHLAVDGGNFPLFAPATPTTFALPYAIEAAFVVIAALLFFVGVRRASQLRTLRYGLPLLAAVVVLSAVLYVYTPSAHGFTRV
jgi:hypothetical protein